MASTSPVLTDLIPEIYKAMDVVSRELTGFIPAVSLDAGMERVAKDQTIRTFVAPASTASDFTPGQLPPNSGDQTIGNVTMAITKERIVPIRWNGNAQREVDGSFGWKQIFQDQTAQAIRTLVNETENDLASLYVKASRAIDPKGTTLFDAANYNDVANVRKILDDNGAPLTDRHLILNTTAGAALRGNAQYAGANTAGREDIVRQGVLHDVHNMLIRESAGVDLHTKGTQTNTDTDDTGYAIGATVITLDASTPSGSGTIVAGDVIIFAGDTNKYVVASGDADTSDGGTITLAAPGLLVAIPTAETAITTVDEPARNMAFSRNAIHLATRLLPIPFEGDSATGSVIVTDPRSGLTMEVREYKEYGQIQRIVGMSYGFEMIKPEHCALLIDAA